MSDARELMRVHIETLFTHDAHGRMLRVNAPDGDAAPRFFLGRTPEGIEWRVRDDVDDDLEQALAATCADEPVGERALRPLDDSTRYERLLGGVGPSASTWSGPAYCFPPSVAAHHDAVLITGENSDLLRPHLTPWLPDVVNSQPLLAFVVDGRAVSVCCSVRIAPVAHEAGVETVPEFRGRGHAIHVAAAWAEHVRRSGRIPMYSTSWQNTASQRLARKLGLQAYGSDFHVD